MRKNSYFLAPWNDDVNMGPFLNKNFEKFLKFTPFDGK